jgi:hypothetical protein
MHVRVGASVAAWRVFLPQPFGSVRLKHSHNGHKRPQTMTTNSNRKQTRARVCVCAHLDTVVGLVEVEGRVRLALEGISAHSWRATVALSTVGAVQGDDELLQST